MVLYSLIPVECTQKHPVRETVEGLGAYSIRMVGIVVFTFWAGYGSCSSVCVVVGRNSCLGYGTNTTPEHEAPLGYVPYGDALYAGTRACDEIVVEQ